MVAANTSPSPASASAFSVLIENQNRALAFCFDAFSLREPGSTSLENAMAPFILEYQGPVCHTGAPETT
jgi:hypothetical protein